MIILSADHGSANGAAAVVLVDRRPHLLCGVAWQTRKRGARLLTYDARGQRPEVREEPVRGTPTGDALLWLLISARVPHVDLVVVEGTLAHAKTGRDSLVRLGEAAGEVVGTLRHVLRVEPVRLHAQTWRPLVGVPQAPASLCASEARRLVSLRVDGVPPELAKIDHFADACLMADAAASLRRARRL